MSSAPPLYLRVTAGPRATVEGARHETRGGMHRYFGRRPRKPHEAAAAAGRARRSSPCHQGRHRPSTCLLCGHAEGATAAVAARTGVLASAVLQVAMVRTVGP